MADPAGLSQDEARRRLDEFGPNAIAEERPHRLRQVARRFWAPVPWMIEATIALQIVLGEYVEAGVIAALLIFNVALGTLHDERAGKVVAALKSKLALLAVVRRNGVWTKIPAAGLVPGDAIRLGLGAVVPADARIVEGTVLVDQAMLTGESMPVEVGPGRIAYSGALVRRGAATAEVIATGPRTYFGRTAELVRIGHAESSEQKAVLTAVRDLAVLNGAVVILIVAYAHWIAMPLAAVLPLVLTALLASIPVALPATFTFAAALGAHELAGAGVLLTRLSALHEAAGVDVLCADKTGTLTRATLEVVKVQPASGHDAEQVLRLAALASADEGADPVDAAIRSAAAVKAIVLPHRAMIHFTPFDPATKMSQALVTDAASVVLRAVKGAVAVLASLAHDSESAVRDAEALAREGYRVLGVAGGAPDDLRFAGLIALSDPPRKDSKALVRDLKAMGVQTVMVTGDAAETAATVAREVGLAGPVCPSGRIPDRVAPTDFAVYAGVFPEDKYRLIAAFQRNGHMVGMCGDGANDAPALRQAQIGIAVSTATDIAKAAAGVVLTEPGLGGIVAGITEGRATFQRIMTYTLNTLVKKIELVLLIALGLIVTGSPILTPMLMVLLLVTNDFLTMSLATDRAPPSPKPMTWRIDRVAAAAAILGLGKLAFSLGMVMAGHFLLGLDAGRLQALAFVTLVFGGQATVYALRERRRLWRSRPSGWLMAATAFDVAFAVAFVSSGLLVPRLDWPVMIAIAAASAVFALALDTVKLAVLPRLGLA